MRPRAKLCLRKLKKGLNRPRDKNQSTEMRGKNYDSDK